MELLSTRMQRHQTLLASLDGRGPASSLDRLTLRIHRDKLRREQEIFNLALLLANQPPRGGGSGR